MTGKHKDTVKVAVKDIVGKIERGEINVAAPLVKIEGIAVVRDKDGNIKGTMKFTNEVDKDAT
jgi:hypothetical protein